MRLSLLSVLATALLATAQVPSSRSRLWANLLKKPSSAVATVSPVITPAPAVLDGHGDHGDHGDVESAAPVATAIPEIPGDHGDGHSEHGGHGSGAVTEPETTIPDGFFIEPDLDPKNVVTPGARIVDQVLGPYTIKGGEAKNFFETSVKMPCTNCWITAAQGTLEYKDGSEANINTGAWLHHMVMMKRSSGTPSPGKYTCKGIMGLIDIPMRVFWSTGNERVVQRTNADGKYGHKVTDNSKASMTFELMNESQKDATYYMRLRYEVIDITSPDAAGYKSAMGIWMDVGGCTGSDVPAKEGVYQLESPIFKVAHGGRLLDTAAHLHDGGTHLIVYRNGEPICNSGVLYGRKTATREPAGSAHGGMLHISDAHVCRDFGEIKKGDELKVVAFYDATKYPQMVHGGKLHPVMGIAVMAMAPNPEI